MGMQVRCIFVWREKQILSDLRDKDVLFKRSRKIEISKKYICINYDTTNKKGKKLNKMLCTQQEREREKEREKVRD